VGLRPLPRSSRRPAGRTTPGVAGNDCYLVRTVVTWSLLVIAPDLKALSALVLVCALLLAGCGGGGEGSESPPAPSDSAVSGQPNQVSPVQADAKDARPNAKITRPAKKAVKPEKGADPSKEVGEHHSKPPPVSGGSVKSTPAVKPSKASPSTAEQAADSGGSKEPSPSVASTGAAGEAAKAAATPNSDSSASDGSEVPGSAAAEQAAG
jgi:hypothetical protein